MGTNETLHELLSEATGIKHLFNFEEASVAQKMSWASNRVTTRIEDQAYCLLGIFGINMPPLYGEGEGAFLRLQLEILKISNDESIFAWQPEGILSGSLLAPSPISFRNAGDVISRDFPMLERLPYMMTNKGLEIWVRMEEDLATSPFGSRKDPSRQLYRIELNCARVMNTSAPLTIDLLRESANSDVYHRTMDTRHPNPDRMAGRGGFPRQLEVEVGSSKWSKIWVQNFRLSDPSVRIGACFRIQTSKLSSLEWEIVRTFITHPERGHWGVKTSDGVMLKLSYSYAFLVLRRTTAMAEIASIFMLKLSSYYLETIAFATSYDVEAFKNGTRLDQDLFNASRSSIFGDYEITLGLSTFAKSVGSGKYMKVSIQKTRGPGSRKIIGIQLEEVQEEDLGSTNRIY